MYDNNQSRIKDKESKLNMGKYPYKDIANLIPIACHYNSRTLITKNGELIQIIEIGGYVNSEYVSFRNELRKVLRESLYEALETQDLSMYIHVVRRKTGISRKDSLDNMFTDSLDKRWRKYNNLGNQLTNTLYVTIVHKGLKGKFNLIKSFSAVIFNKFRVQQFQIIDEYINNFNLIVDSLNFKLLMYQSRILDIISVDDVNFISEPLSFFYELLHLNKKNVYIDEVNASEQIADLNISYGFNTIDIQDDNGKRHGAVFTLKYPYNLDHESLDVFLQMPQSFILTETIMIVPRNAALMEFNKHKKILDAGKSEVLSECSQLEEILLANTGKVNDYCKQQINIVLFDVDKVTLNNNITTLCNIFRNTGVVVIREDFNMPKTFFAQLPGNFKFLSREVYNATKLSANFTLIHHKNIGSYSGSKWGEAVSIIKTIKGLPYYFNFHNEENGNTIIYGPDAEMVKSIMRFFVAQAMRLRPKVVYVHTVDDRGDFMKELNANVIEIDLNASKPLIQIDIFDISNFDNDIEIIVDILVYHLLSSDNPVDDSKILMKTIMPWVMVDVEKRIELMIEFINKDHSNSNTILITLIEFLKSDIYENFLSNNVIPDIKNYNVTNIVIKGENRKSIEVKLILGLYLINIYKILNDNKPTIIAVNNSDFLFNMCSTNSRLGNWLKNLSKCNAMAFIGTSNKKMILDNAIFSDNLNEFATHIFLGDRLADKKLQGALELKNREVFELKKYDRSHKAIMIRQLGESLFMSFDLTKIPEINKMIG